MRFVYYRSGNAYLSLEKQPEVINAAYDADFNPCAVQGSLVDMCGFDIFKYLRLLSASNPTSIEWLFSSILYWGNNDISLRAYMRDNFNPERLFYHYFSLAKNNYIDFIVHGKALTYKKYLYSLRGLLNAKYVYEFDRIPPLNFMMMADEARGLMPEAVYERLCDVVKIKSSGREKNNIDRIKVFDDFFDVELDKRYSGLKKRETDIAVFDAFLGSCLSAGWCS